MFPGSTVSLALGLHDVTAQCGSLVNNGPGMYSSSPGDLNSTSWHGPHS